MLSTILSPFKLIPGFRPLFSGICIYVYSLSIGYPHFRYVKSLLVLFHLDSHIASEPQISGGQPPDIAATLDPK